jgi:hypothetical protein
MEQVPAIEIARRSAVLLTRKQCGRYPQHHKTDPYGPTGIEAAKKQFHELFDTDRYVSITPTCFSKNAAGVKLR